MATTKRVMKKDKPHRKDQSPSRLCSVEPGSAHLAAALVAARVKSIGHARCCCAFVFVRRGDVYVISEESSVALQWSRDYFADWVGCYGGTVNLDDLIADIQQHLASVD